MTENRRFIAHFCRKQVKCRSTFSIAFQSKGILILASSIWNILCKEVNTLLKSKTKSGPDLQIVFTGSMCGASGVGVWELPGGRTASDARIARKTFPRTRNRHNGSFANWSISFSGEADAVSSTLLLSHFTSVNIRFYTRSPPPSLWAFVRLFGILGISSFFSFFVVS